MLSLSEWTGENCVRFPIHLFAEWRPEAEDLWRGVQGPRRTLP